MSGVATGTRLEQLQTLRRRVSHQLDSARRRDDRQEAHRLATLRDRLETEMRHEGFKRPPSPAAAKRPGLAATDQAVTTRLAALGVTARDVKTWAVDQGLLPAVRRGRVAARLVEAYAAAHPEGATP